MNNGSISISVIIPAYNVEKWIDESFDSVIHQTVPFDEIIVINDGSTDGTYKICKQYKAKNGNIKLIDQNNKGLGAARNICIETTETDYFVLLDADDKLDEKTCELLHESLTGKDLDVLFYDGVSFGDNALFDSSKEFFSRNCDFSSEIFSGKELFDLMVPKHYRESACFAAYRTEFIKNSAIRFPEGIYYEDCPFTFEVFHKAKRVMHKPLPLYQRRYRPGSIMNSSFSDHHMYSYATTSELMWKYIIEHEDSYEKKEILYAMPYLRGLCNRLANKGMNAYEEKTQSRINEALKVFIELIETGLDKITVYAKDSDFKMRLLFSLLFVRKMNDSAISQKIRLLMADLKSWGKDYAEKAFERMQLADPEKCIGIYGIGKSTEDMLSAYNAIHGEIRAKVLYIDSNKIGQEYGGKIVCSLSEAEKKVDVVVVSSSKYHNEISGFIRDKAPELSIVDPYEEIHFSYFDGLEMVNT